MNVFGYAWSLFRILYKKFIKQTFLFQNKTWDVVSQIAPPSPVSSGYLHACISYCHDDYFSLLSELKCWVWLV